MVSREKELEMLRTQLIDERGKQAFIALLTSSKLGIVAADLLGDLLVSNETDSDLRLNVLHLIDEALILLGKAEGFVKSIEKLKPKKKVNPVELDGDF